MFGLRSRSSSYYFNEAREGFAMKIIDLLRKMLTILLIIPMMMIISLVMCMNWLIPSDEEAAVSSYEDRNQ